MSAAQQPLRVGLAGLGNVGAGVAKVLMTHAELIGVRAGRPIRLVAVAARDRSKDRGVDLSNLAWEADARALAARPDVDVVVEVIGGIEGIARQTVEAALAAGKHVVTANKALLATHGVALAQAAEKAGVALRWEAAVAGGIPVIKSVGEGLAANRITRLFGVMNGTCNYILTEMERTGRDYADILRDAQALGYAEADPTADVGGFDTAHKLACIAALAFGTKVDFGGVEIEGIERVSLADIRVAAEMGYRIKLLGVARMTAKGLEQRVAPVLVKRHSIIGQLEGATNAVVVEGDFVGQVAHVGRGAGEGPTASAVVADLIDIARGGRLPAFGVPVHRLTAAPRCPSDAHEGPYYLNLLLVDRPGALARIASVLGDCTVSIESMQQQPHDGDGARVLIVTHSCVEADLRRAISRMGALDVCLAQPVALRIESA